MEKLRVISHSDEQFSDRSEAGALLARELEKYRGKDAVVLGIPRGGIVVAKEIAHKLDADLDIVLSRKLGAPGNPELALGAVSEDGKLFLRDPEMYGEVGESSYIKQEQAREVEEIKRRAGVYRKARPKVHLAGRQVIIVDDGLATGATMQAALWAARQEKPERLIVAVPVAPEDTAGKIEKDADEILVLRIPPFFAAVGQFYAHFDQTDDSEVLAILKEEYKRR